MTSPFLGPISGAAPAVNRNPAPNRNRHHEIKIKKLTDEMQSLRRFITRINRTDRGSEDTSGVAEEAMDQSSLNKSTSKISAAGEIIESKRAKKTVERLDFQAPKQKEKLKTGDGSGDKLGDIPRTGYQITKMKPVDLKPLHTILFDRPGKMAILKKNLRLFNGFPFDAESEQYTNKRERLLKNSKFTKTKLKVVCGVLDLEKKGDQSDLVDRILTFLIAPNSGKRLPVKKKKRKSKKKLLGDDSMVNTKKKSKTKPMSSSSSPKKSKTGSKSKAIIMVSSSDEDDDEEDEKVGASAEAEGSDTEDKPSDKEEDQSDKSEESADEEEEESPKSQLGRGKSASKKSAPVKRLRIPARKTGPPKKRAKKEVSAESEPAADTEAEEKPKKKKSAPVKPAAKTKKVDSSSNSKNNTNTVEDSSDDDEPLIKMIKKVPTDEQLKETVQSLLKEADLDEMTIKQICQRVFDTFPDHELASKKDYIKQTVKSQLPQM
ncbi:protein DEK isoform X2 [Cottoperca gobio]|uniref:Protein DEK isoform X2 n=1 Tax=Cottoperca gobio TaxID=56716 RepID=A0A6J2RE66_COTGO|nr:protein DEK-like isoform X2 [Cottoperca gobio]